MYGSLKQFLKSELSEVENAGLFKKEKVGRHTGFWKNGEIIICSCDQK